MGLTRSLRESMSGKGLESIRPKTSCQETIRQLLVHLSIRMKAHLLTPLQQESSKEESLWLQTHMRLRLMDLIDLLITQGLTQLHKVFSKTQPLKQITESLDLQDLLLVTVIPLQRLEIIAKEQVPKRFVIRARCLQQSMKFVDQSSRLSHTRPNWLNSQTLISLTPMKSSMKRKKVSFTSMT